MTPTELRTKIRDIDSLIAKLQLEFLTSLSKLLREDEQEAAIDPLRKQRQELVEALEKAERKA